MGLKLLSTDTEPKFLSFQGAQESTPRNQFLCSLAGQYDNPIPTRFLDPINCLKIPVQMRGERGIEVGGYGQGYRVKLLE